MKRLASILPYIAALLLIASCGTEGDYSPPPKQPDPVETPKDGSNRMTAYSLRLTRDGVKTEHTGVIDDAAGTITVPTTSTAWISDLRQAVAVFSAQGVSVEAGGRLQSSGVTANDFQKSVAYVVTAENGDERRYTVRVVSPQTSGLPVIHLDTDGRSIPGKWSNPDGTYTPVSVTLNDPVYSTHNLGEVKAGIRVRGNSTAGYPKKAYRLRFDEKTAALGYTKARSWVLLANWQDPTLVMNTVALEIGRRMGIPYTNHAEHVEVFLNGAYNGSYVLTEQIQAGNGRVDIDETSGILLNLDSNYDVDHKFKSASTSMPVNIQSPDLGAAAAGVSLASIQADYNRMEEAVMGSGFPGNNWRDYIDVASLIDFILINEIVRNAELQHPKSTYLWKRAGGKWTFGPPWDFDWGYGYDSSRQAYWNSATGQLYYQGRAGSGSRAGVKFFNRFFDDPAFRAEYKARWNVVKPLLADIGLFIDGIGGRLTGSAGWNKQRWDTDYNSWCGLYIKDHTEQVADMKSWLGRRVAYLDGVINNL